MNTALAENFSAFSESETPETLPRENFEDELTEISQQRIDSFFKAFSEPDQEGEFNKNENHPNILFFLLKDKQPVALAPEIRIRQRAFISSRKWEGYVTEIYEDSFSARITDLSEQYPDEEVEIELRAVSEDDLHLVRTGAVFNWHIGYETEHGTRKRVSIIRFRRLPVWTESDFEKAEESEKKLKNFLR